MQLKGKNALVTGGSVRIGRAICEALAEEGCGVVIHYHRSALQAAELAAVLRARSTPAKTVQGLLQTQEQCDRVLDDAWAAAGGLDILVNNAAVFHHADLAASDEPTLMRELQINALAPIYLTRAFAARRRAGGPDSAGGEPTGKVVNLLDRRVAGNETGCLPYLLSKNMLAAFTRNAAKELAPGITVNAVAPGAVLPPPGEDDDYLALHAGPAPLQHRCTPSDIAAAIVYLLRSDAVTGQILFVDAGQHLL